MDVLSALSREALNINEEIHLGQSKKQLSDTEILKRNSFCGKLIEYLTQNAITKFTTNIKTYAETVPLHKISIPGN